MTETFEKLKALLHQQGSLTDAEIEAAESETGVLTDEERVWISAEQHDLLKREGEAITLDQYLAATQVLDSADPGSAEYQEATRIVEAFESAA